MMEDSEFPLEHYMGALVRLLDAIKYRDNNYDHDEQVRHLQHGYSEIAKHFAQPIQRDALKVDPNRLAAAMRTNVQLVVSCWVKVSSQVMVAIGIYFVYIILLDDSNIDPGPDMGSFS